MKKAFNLMCLIFSMVVIAGGLVMSSQAQTTQPLSRAERRCSYQKKSVDASTPQEFFAVSISSHNLSNRKWVCFTNLDATASNIVWISTYSTTNMIEGDPVYGTQTKCFDWGFNIRTFAVQNTAQSAANVHGSQCE
jgi:hypothetical protein